MDKIILHNLIREKQSNPLVNIKGTDKHMTQQPSHAIKNLGSKDRTISTFAVKIKKTH